jgi:hypothetical protein
MTKLQEKLLSLNENGRLLGREETFRAEIYVGAYDTEEDFTRPVAEIKETCQFFVQDEGLCVNVRETWYSYGDGEGEGGNEPGAVVELIHYPRFPRDNPEESITVQALNLAEVLMERMNQERISVVCSDETYTLQNPEHPNVTK